MKKLYIFLIVWLFLFTFGAAAESPAPPLAGSAASATSKTVVEVDARNQSVNSGSRGVVIPPLKQDGAVIAPSQGVSWIGSEKVPAYYRGQGFNYIWIDPEFLQDGITVETLKNIGKPSSFWASLGWGKRAIKKPELIIIKDGLPANTKSIRLLSDYPDPKKYQAKKVGEYDADGFARASILKLVGDGGVRLAGMGAKYVMVLATSKFLSEGKVKALGTAGVLGKLAGPAGKDEEIVAVGAAGAGIGGATAYVDRVPKIKIVAWYEITPEPELIIPGPWPEKEVAPPPPPKPEAKLEAVSPPLLPPPPKAEAAPRDQDCKAEKEEIKDLNEIIREASGKLAKAEQEKIIVPPCRFSIEFEWGKWTIGADQRENLEGMARYLVQYDAAVKKLGGKFTLVGHADETVAEALNSPDRDYVNPHLGLQRSRSSKASLGPRVLWAGGTVDQVSGIAPVSAGRDTPAIVNAGKEAKNRHVYLVIVIPDIRGHNE